MPLFLIGIEEIFRNIDTIRHANLTLDRFDPLLWSARAWGLSKDGT
jgi:hypothetical protein